MAIVSKGLHLVLLTLKPINFAIAKVFVETFINKIVNKYPGEVAASAIKEKRQDLV